MVQTSEKTQNEDFTELPRAQVVITLVCILLTMFLAALDQTIVSTATPTIVAELGGFDRYVWITTGYLVASTTAAPIVGRLSDIYGRKWFFVGSVVLFIIGSILCGLSQDMTQLIVFRVIQGLGGGTIMAVTFISIADLFPPEQRGKYMGILAACFGLSSVVGPTLGGFLTDSLSWNWIFFVNIPLAGPVIFLLMKYFPDSSIETDPEKRKLDYVGMVLLVISVVSFILGISLGGVQYPWNSPPVIGLILLGLVSGAMFGAIIFVPLYFQGVLGASATSSGTFLTPMMLGVVAGASISGQVLSRTGGHFRIQGLLGIGVMALGVFLFSILGSDSDYGMAVTFIIILGFGLGSTFPTLTLAVQNFTPSDTIGAATSLTQFARTIGGLIGLSALGSVLSMRFEDKLEKGIMGLEIDVPPLALEELKKNPRALIDSESQSSILDSAAAEIGSDSFNIVVEVLKSSLSGAITDVFNVALVILLVSIVVCFFLSKTGFRKRNG